MSASRDPIQALLDHERMITSIARAVWPAARRAGIPWEDLLQEARLWAWEALQRHDGTKGAGLTHWVHRAVTGRLATLVRDKARRHNGYVDPARYGRTRHGRLRKAHDGVLFTHLDHSVPGGDDDGQPATWHDITPAPSRPIEDRIDDARAVERVLSRPTQVEIVTWAWRQGRL